MMDEFADFLALQNSIKNYILREIKFISGDKRVCPHDIVPVYQNQRHSL